MNSKIRKKFKNYENDYEINEPIKKNLSGSKKRKNRQKRIVRMIKKYLDFGNVSGNEIIRKILLFHPVSFDYFKQRRIEYVRKIKLTYTQHKYKNSRTPWAKNGQSRINHENLLCIKRRLNFCGHDRCHDHDIKEIIKDINLIRYNLCVNIKNYRKKQTKNNKNKKKNKKILKMFQKKETKILYRNFKIKYYIF